MFSILEYLYVNAENIPLSKYKIITKAPGIRQQRPDTCYSSYFTTIDATIQGNKIEDVWDTN